ncbi:MAG: 4'-phosphopantetheinyl transferase superfamily protein [Bacteroidaceae bacterium]|nr:4'-phosphopantetheinyl transferase superfamily protein [Bacteroidaceae bacterium]
MEKDFKTEDPLCPADISPVMGRAIRLARLLETSRMVFLPITGEGRGEGLLILDNLDAITSEELEAAIASLPQWRREKALRFKFEQGRKECAFSYLLLCQALREVYRITEQPSFSYGEHGKPELSFNSQLSTLNSQLFFNISHCKQAIACVVSNQPVGVDVERIGRYNESLARHVLNDSEFALVSQSPDPQVSFTRFWTQKEAIVKLTGRGIDDDLPNLLLKYNNVSLHTEDHLDKGYILTVANYRV